MNFYITYQEEYGCAPIIELGACADKPHAFATVRKKTVSSLRRRQLLQAQLLQSLRLMRERFMLALTALWLLRMYASCLFPLLCSF